MVFRLGTIQVMLRPKMRVERQREEGGGEEGGGEEEGEKEEEEEEEDDRDEDEEERGRGDGEAAKRTEAVDRRNRVKEVGLVSCWAH